MSDKDVAFKGLMLLVHIGRKFCEKNDGKCDERSYDAIKSSMSGRQQWCSIPFRASQ